MPNKHFYKKKQPRNTQITIAVLQGASLQSQAEQHGISTERARQTVRQILRRYYPSVSKLSLKECRAYSTEIITQINLQQRENHV